MKRRAFLQYCLATLTVSISPRLFAETTITPHATISQHPLITVEIPKGQFVALCFHDVRDDFVPGIDKDPYAINTKRLAALFDWIRLNNWNPVSLQQIIEAREGKASLPDNAVLLSWDDGLVSIYTKVFPLLQVFHYPALIALETGWLTQVHRGQKVEYQGEGFVESPDNANAIDQLFQLDDQQNIKLKGANDPLTVAYNGVEMGAQDFVSWSQLREMQASNLVEFATHTHGLHQGILANPQGDVQPSAITRQYLDSLMRYESETEYHARILKDLNMSAAIIEREVGVRPRAVVWPYGATNLETEAIAAQAGLSVSFSLGGHKLGAKPRSRTPYGRLLVMHDPSPVSIRSQIDQFVDPQPVPERAVQVDLDYIYDPDPKMVDRNLGMLLERIKALKIRTVYLQAFADPEGKGTTSALYFPNHVLPMRADLFNRVSWQLRTRAGVRVFAWLPMLAYRLPDPQQQARLAVKINDADGLPQPAQRDYDRLSPFLPETAQLIGDIYGDLGKNTTGIAGLLIHDDAYLAEDEDVTASHPEARWPGSDQSIKTYPLSAREKTQALIDFGKVVTNRLRYYNDFSSGFSVARNMYARVVMDPAAEARFAQALEPFMRHYNHVALMAMPFLDDAKESPGQWLQKLARTVASTPGAMQRVVFELQAKNWKTDQWIDGATLKQWMQLLVRMGGVNLAYYPDDFFNNQPPFQATFEAMSLQDSPYHQLKL